MFPNETAQFTIKYYIPAVLKRYKSKGNGYCIEYFVVHPQTFALTRQRMKLNRERKKFAKLRDFREYATAIAVNINAKLAGGWSPYFESENTRLYTKLDAVVNEYLECKSKELRENSMRSYSSFGNRLCEQMKKVAPGMYFSIFGKIHALNLLDTLSKGASNKTYNNNLKQARALWEWAKENCYTKENPFASIKKRREERKNRTIIDAPTRAKIDDYLKEHNKPLRLLSHLVFSALIRPKEAALIQVKEININEHYIYIPPEKSKTHYPRYATISAEIVQMLRELNIERYKGDFYLFGANTCTPGTMHFNSHTWSKQWEKMRRALKLPPTMQLYSLRDSGINNMLKSGMDALTVMQHADHHDLSITTRYANHVDAHLSELIYNNAPKF